jgi:hypothetical protein
VLKFGRSGAPHRRFLRVTDDGDAVYYVSARKRLVDSTLPFSEVERVQVGQHTSVFGRRAKAYAHLENLSLSIVCAGGRTLDLVFDTPELLEAW